MDTANAATHVILSSCVSSAPPAAALSSSSAYSSSSHRRCSADRGSFSVTGMEILLRSLPMFLHSRFHRLTPSAPDMGTGSFCLLPISMGILEEGWAGMERLLTLSECLRRVWEEVCGCSVELAD